MKSWKTTTAGVVAIVGGAVVAAYQIEPEMMKGFPTWFKAAGYLATTIGTGCVGLFARDNKVTSEQAGAKPND